MPAPHHSREPTNWRINQQQGDGEVDNRVGYSRALPCIYCLNIFLVIFVRQLSHHPRTDIYEIFRDCRTLAVDELPETFFSIRQGTLPW